MSHNQSRFHKSEGQPRRPGRSTTRGFYGGGNGGGGRGGAVPPSGNRSFKKSVNGQPAVTQSSGGSATPNGTHVPAPSRGPPSSTLGSGAKPIEASVQRASRAVPKGPSSSSSQPAAGASESAASSTPPKGDTSKSFNLQFGSISPGLVNGMPIPARTSSAPPNLHEQKQAQARHDSFRAVPTMPAPSAPIHQQLQPQKDVGGNNKSNTGEFHPPPPIQAKRVMHVPVSSSPNSVPPKPSVLPIGGMPVHMPFQQPQIPMQFGSPSPQMQAHVVPANSLQMSMAMPMMNAPQVLQHMFIPNFQSHPLQPQTLMHQGQSFGFAPQMGHQLPSHLGNLGYGISPQYTQQQPANFGGQRKTTVKITHPETHEELKLDKRTDSVVATSALPTQRIRPATSPLISSAGDSGSIRSQTEGSIQESIRMSNSLKDRENKTGEKDAIHIQQQNQAAPADATDYTKLSSKVIKDTPDVSAQEAPRGSEKLETILRSDSPTATPKITSSTEEDANSVKFRASEACKVEELSPLAGSDVSLEKEAYRSSSLDHFNSPELLNNHNFLKEEGPLEESTSVNEQKSIDSALSDKKLIVTKHVTVEAPSDILPDGTTEAVNSVLSVKQEDVRDATSEKENICEDFDVEAVSFISEVDGKLYEAGVSSSVSSDIKDAITNNCETNSSQDVASGDSVTSAETKQNVECQSAQLSCGAGTVVLSGPKDKPTLEPARASANAGKKKKKIKDILLRADAAGASDLYNAYKGPEEKHEVVDSLENLHSPSTVDRTDVLADVPHNDAVAGEEDEQSRTEIDDWEDAAEISTPKLTSEGDLLNKNEAKRRYSRDFLLTFAEQCTDLPVGFKISEVPDALMSNPHSSSGRITDRSPGASRVDRRMAGVADDDRWTRASTFGPGRDIRLDNVSFRPGQGVNHEFLRNPRAPYNHLASGILSGPVQSIASQGGMPRSNSDANRWQRAADIQRGLMPSPPAPSQIMHKAANKYEVGKVSDKEQAKQRQLKAILNKLTPQNFDKLFLQVKEVNIDNTVTLTGVISQIFDKALTEPTFCEMYANFCVHLSNDLPHFNENNEKITFKRLLLNKCQEEFGRGEREEAEANRAEEDGEIKQTEEEREEKRIQARRRMLGNIRLIGELYKKGMLTERIMHECINKLLGECENPDEEDVEALCKLMSTIGEMIDQPRAKVHMDVYFDRMLKLSTNQKLSSRVRFMLRDAIDLRKNKWQQRRKVEGPKKIDEVHRDAAQERQAQVSRLARGPVVSSAPRRGSAVDYSSRGSGVLPSLSSPQIRTIRDMPVQVRGHATQNVRMDDRHQFESRVLSVPLPQRSTDDSITLGPQGGLARGMSSRGQPLIPNPPSAKVSPNLGDSRRSASVANSYNSISKEDSKTRYMQDKFSSVQYDPPSSYDRSPSVGSRDSGGAYNVTDRSAATTIPGRIHGSSGILHAPSETKQLSEESLREKSMSAIREFYSAKDEEELALCIKELKSPSFYPSMVSLWVTDSFERKDMERDLLAKLLINLCKSRDSLLSHSQLIQGFVSILSSLEDAVNDAPRAAEFLGHIFAKITLGDVVPLSEIARLIHEGGEEPGSLVETGLACEVLGSTLQFIRAEKGDSALSEIRMSSGLRVEDFRPPHSTRLTKLDALL